MQVLSSCIDRGLNPTPYAAMLPTIEVSRSGAPCSAWPRLATPPHAFPELNVLLEKQPTASLRRALRHAFENTGFDISWMMVLDIA
ncbi:hypothetical protein L3X38_042905 [Prunus dulcis]|uniref:Uncharacterized protein n=1 Tax=Prunus dulcis TaxID=3755 RepID=A0AAD4UX50_PRUDU|nr:hypothetical protein L3X38_042905 [Prunus dulcis]